MNSVGEIAARIQPSPDGAPPTVQLPPDDTVMSLLHSGRPAQCTTCRDVGWYGIAGLAISDPRFGKSIWCEPCNGGRRTLDIDAMLAGAHVPEEKRHLTLGLFEKTYPEHTDLLSAARAFAQKGHSKSGARGLYLYGKTGVRKTGLGLGVFADLLPTIVGTARYWVWSDFLDSIKATWKTSSALTPAEAIAEANRHTLLMIDEFGGAGSGQQDHEWRDDIARRLTDARHDAAHRGKITIWTSNLDLDQIAADFGGFPIGEAIASRLSGHCSVFEIVGTDARTEKHKNKKRA